VATTSLSLSLSLDGNNINADIENLIVDRVRVNELVSKVDAWVASEVARRVKLSKTTVSSSRPLAARAAVLAFGDEVLDHELPGRNDQWSALGGRDFAAAYQLPRA
jgi:hypothetical protein